MNVDTRPRVHRTADGSARAHEQALPPWSHRNEPGKPTEETPAILSLLPAEASILVMRRCGPAETLGDPMAS